jgi:ubiquitin-conjugating enzyme E2 variant
MAVMLASYALAWLHAASDASGGGGGGGLATLASSASSFAPVLLASLGAYVLSDLGTAVYHWFVDNYTDSPTAVAFQGHHRQPWTITQRQFANNMHKVFRPAALPASLIALLALTRAGGPGPAGPALEAFLSSFLLLVCMSQQFHAWAHAKRSDLPAAVLFLQERGVLIGRKAHGAHHRPPFEGNYAIVSGLWNGPLDRSGFFRGLENVAKAATGVEPRCWHPPAEGWEEDARPAGMTMSSDLDEDDE